MDIHVQSSIISSVSRMCAVGPDLLDEGKAAGLLKVNTKPKGRKSSCNTYYVVNTHI